MAELTRMSADELRRDLQLKHAEAAKMRLGLEMQSEKNSGLYKAYRRDIARMTMVSSQKASQSAKKPVKQSGSKSKKS